MSQQLRAPTLYEKLLRKFSVTMQIISLLPFYSLLVVCVGASLTPAIMCYRLLDAWSADFSQSVHIVCLGLSLGVSYLVYGFTLLVVAPSANWILRCKLTAWRGAYFSGPAVKWYFHNGLTYIARYTFLEMITPTPMTIWFYRAMGMKIGHNVQINTTHISDPSLIEIGDKATIGGSAVIVGHYGQHGYLVLAPVKIGKGATIGLRAIIMGGSEIGEGAKIMANSVVLPKMKIPAGETWGGIPAQPIDTKKINFGDSSATSSESLQSPA
jgi:acetyltransferase-like isoleucine patch superfamily enzyme